MPDLVALSVGGICSNAVVNRGWLSKTNARKLFQTVSMLGTAAVVAAMPWTGCNQAAAIAVLAGASFFSGIHSGGYLLVVGDITDNFASTVYAVTNLLTYATAVVAPYLVGLVLEARELKYRREQWDLLFYITSGILVVGALLFDLLASAERQPWDTPMVRKGSSVSSAPALIIDTNGYDADAVFTVRSCERD